MTMSFREGFILFGLCLAGAMPVSRHDQLANAFAISDHLSVREFYGFMKLGLPPSLVELCLWGLLCRAALFGDAT